MDDIRLGLISCWYNDKSCGRFAHNLACALEKLGVDITVISANCLCFRDDPFNPDLFFSPCQKIKFSDFYWKPAPKGVNYFRSIAELSGDILKGYAYLKKAQSLPLSLLHYQQTQGSFSFLPLLSFLSYPVQAKRVVAIHEIDTVQKQLKIRSREFPTIRLNKIYHKADAVIVQNKAAREALEDLGVDPAKVRIIPHGMHMPEGTHMPEGIHMPKGTHVPEPLARNRIIFCGGHHLTSGKGFDIFLEALLILKTQNIIPQIMIYGLNSEYGQEEGQKTILETGISNQIKWLDYSVDDALFEEFRKVMFMVIPYTTSEAGTAVTTAMANAVPVIASRKVGLPEYLAESGLYLEENNAEELAGKMLQLIQNSGLREDLGRQLYKRASELYSWEAVAQKTLDLYRSLLLD